MKKYLILILPLLLCAATCKKNDEPLTLPNATQSGANTFGANINGVAWSHQSTGASLSGLVHSFEQNMLYVQGSYQNKSLSIYAGPITHPGVYALQVNGDPNKAAEYQSFSASTTYQTNSAYGGTITITKLDLQQKIVSGAFSFDAENVGQKGDVAHITDGRFDVTFN